MSKNTRMYPGLHVALVCFVVAGIGAALTTAVCLQYHLSSWWGLLGALVMAVVGYLMEDPANVRDGLVHAWRKVVHWRPDWQWLKETIVYGLMTSVWISTVLTCLFYPIVTLTEAEKQRQGLGNHDGGPAALLGFFFCIIVVVSLKFTHDTVTSRKLSEESRVESKRGTRWLFRVINPVSLPIYAVIYAFKGIGWLKPRFWGYVGKAAWSALAFTVCVCLGIFAMFWYTFRYIHSERRLICFVDTFLGVLIGFRYGYYHESVLLSALVGGVVGFAAGFINYELISLRLLKIVPQPA